jgi:hypothetical protein
MIGYAIALEAPRTPSQSSQELKLFKLSFKYFPRLLTKVLLL